MEVVPLLLLVLGAFVTVRTLSLVRARRTAVRRPRVRLLPRPASPVRAVPPALGPRAQARARARAQARAGARVEARGDDEERRAA